MPRKTSATSASAAPAMTMRPRGVRLASSAREAVGIQRLRSDLRVEDVLDGLDGLCADLAGELHAQPRLLDGHDDLRRVGGGARGERLRALGGSGLELLERA